MPAQKQNLLFELQADGPFPSQFVWTASDGTPIDLTGATALLEVRPDYDSDDVVLTLSSEGESAAIAINESVVTLSLPGSEITRVLLEKLHLFGAVEVGVIERDDTTVIVSGDGAFGYYDMSVTLATGEKVRLIEGKACFTREITR